ncbi:MAG: GtrA family protein [Desulfobacteraceae bacterium]|nr:GtrA family protein [Desulfobacteraceae bacterium]
MKTATKTQQNFLSRRWGITGWQGRVCTFSCQAGGYLWVSILGTAAHFSLMALLVQNFDLNPVKASYCGAIMGAGIIYWFNFHFTFRSSTSHQRALGRFAAMAMAGTLINGRVLALALEGGGWPLVPSQALATGMQFGFGFLVSRVWIY